MAAGSKEAASYAAKQEEEASWQGGGRAGESVLNRIMAKMRGDRAVSTVEKSAYDWEGYKDEHGVKDEVEEFAKDGCEPDPLSPSVCVCVRAQWLTVPSAPAFPAACPAQLRGPAGVSAARGPARV